MNHPLCYFPGTSIPVPFVCTEAEAIRVLRLDETAVGDPGRTLRYYREQGHLKAVQVGRSRRYTLPSLLALVERLQEVNPR